MPPMTYLVIAVYGAMLGQPADQATYYAAEDPHACASDAAEIARLIGPQPIRVEVFCSVDRRFAARVFVTVDVLKAEIQKRAKQ